MTRNLLSIIFLAASSFVIGQGNSPFSQFGPGDFYNSNFQSNFSRAGIGASSISGNTLNPVNPATYSQLTLTTGETGIYSSTNYIDLNGEKSTLTNANLSCFALGFPLGNKMGIALGLSPLTKQNYEYSFSDVLTDNTGVDYIYSGDGGLSKAFLGYGASFNGLSVGFNANFVFGRLNDISKVKYSSDDYKNIRFQEYNDVRGFGLETGIQYKYELGPKNYLNFGAIYEIGSDYRTSNYTLANYFTINAATTSNNKVIDAEFHETTYIIDTRETPTKDKITLPSKIQTGISIGELDKWETSIEYRSRGYENYSLNGNGSNFNNSNTVIIGGRIIPNKKALGRSNYWKTISYNIGMLAGNTGIISLNEELNEVGINFGFGLPLRKFKYQTETYGSVVYLGFGYLNRSNSNLGITENYLNLNASIILNDKWFVKRKFQ